MKDDLNRLVQKPAVDKRLEAAATPPPIRSKTGLERQAVGKVDTVEVEAQSTDGLFVFSITVVKP